jgi:hypothetical protein
VRLGRIKGTIMGDGGTLTAEKRFALPTTATIKKKKNNNNK